LQPEVWEVSRVVHFEAGAQPNPSETTFGTSCSGFSFGGAVSLPQAGQVSSCLEYGPSLVNRSLISKGSTTRGL
jgi:hypothetical protein